MGFDDAIEATQNYIVAGEYPRFVVYDASEDTYYDAMAYDDIFRTLMGYDVEPLRNFIRANALEVKNLDV